MLIKSFEYFAKNSGSFTLIEKWKKPHAFLPTIHRIPHLKGTVAQQLVSFLYFSFFSDNTGVNIGRPSASQLCDVLAAGI